MTSPIEMLGADGALLSFSGRLIVGTAGAVFEMSVLGTLAEFSSPGRVMVGIAGSVFTFLTVTRGADRGGGLGAWMVPITGGGGG